MTGILNALIAGVSGAVKDAYFNLVSLLLPGNGTNGAQNNTFLDGSSNNFTITRNGNTTQGTFSPFSQTGWSNYYNGSGYFSSSTALFAYTTGNASTQTFTIEAMVYHTARTTPVFQPYSQCIAGKGNVYMNFGINGTGNLIFLHNDGTERIITSSSTVPLNTWTYVAIVVSGGTATMYIGNSSVGTGTWYGIAAGAISSASYFGKAATAPDANVFQGYISNLRVSSVARTAAIPTSGYANDANTVFLFNSSNQFVDKSSNTYAITVASSGTSVTPFSPFAPTQSYSASAVGGSGYFDGSEDYLTANSAGLELGSNLFTVDGWFYCTGYNGGGAIYSSVNTYPSSTGLLFYVNSTGGYVIDVNGTNIISTGTAPLNTWTHFAIVRSSTGSNGVTLYINGSALTPGTSATNFSSTYAVIGRTGFGAASNYWLGYLSGIRVVVGSANVPSSVPTSPPTAITNTALLLNFTNAGVIDATAKNVLETVGNAQISTTQSKWGGGSMYFNGSSSYLMGAANQQYEFGSGDFTIECWVNISASAANGGIIGKGPVGSLDNSVWSIEFPASGGTFGFYVFAANSGAFIVSSTTNIKTSTWTHIAICKSGNNTRLFVNGTQEGSTYTTGYTISNGNNLWIGGGFYAPTTRTITGYIDDVRLTKFARYTSNFTPPSAPFPVQ